MTRTLKVSTLSAMTAVAALLVVGCSSTNTEAPPANESVEEVESTTPETEEVEEEAAQPEASQEGYQAIYDEYSARLTAECPSLSTTECAEISTEGVSKMAEYMYKAKGTDGQMATYEEWASKLMDVYMASAQ